MKKNPKHSTYIFEYTWGDKKGKRKVHAFNGQKAQQKLENDLFNLFGKVVISSFDLIQKIEPFM